MWRLIHNLVLMIPDDSMQTFTDVLDLCYGVGKEELIGPNATIAVSEYPLQSVHHYPQGVCGSIECL